jgi:hypothetical protein
MDFRIARRHEALPARADKPLSGPDRFRNEPTVKILQVLDSRVALFKLTPWTAKATCMCLHQGYIVPQALDACSAADQAESQTIKLLFRFSCPPLDSQGMVFFEERAHDIWNRDTESIEKLCKQHS